MEFIALWNSKKWETWKKTAHLKNHSAPPNGSRCWCWIRCTNPRRGSWRGLAWAAPENCSRQRMPVVEQQNELRGWVLGLWMGLGKPVLCHWLLRLDNPSLRIHSLLGQSHCWLAVYWPKKTAHDPKLSQYWTKVHWKKWGLTVTAPSP